MIALLATALAGPDVGTAAQQWGRAVWMGNAHERYAAAFVEAVLPSDPDLCLPGPASLSTACLHACLDGSDVACERQDQLDPLCLRTPDHPRCSERGGAKSAFAPDGTEFWVEPFSEGMALCTRDHRGRRCTPTSAYRVEQLGSRIGVGGTGLTIDGWEWPHGYFHPILFDGVRGLAYNATTPELVEVRFRGATTEVDPSSAFRPTDLFEGAVVGVRETYVGDLYLVHATDGEERTRELEEWDAPSLLEDGRVFLPKAVAIWNPSTDTTVPTPEDCRASRTHLYCRSGWWIDEHALTEGLPSTGRHWRAAPERPWGPSQDDHWLRVGTTRYPLKPAAARTRAPKAPPREGALGDPLPPEWMSEPRDVQQDLPRWPAPLTTPIDDPVGTAKGEWVRVDPAGDFEKIDTSPWLETVRASGPNWLQLEDGSLGLFATPDHLLFVRPDGRYRLRRATDADHK